jgi:uncharacterized protein (TIGR00106 family)
MAIMEFSVVPIGNFVSMSKYIAEVVNIVKESKLNHHLCAMGTVVEGELADLLKIVEKAHEHLAKQGVMRVVTTVKLDDRRDKTVKMEDKVKSVERYLGS